MRPRSRLSLALTLLLGVALGLAVACFPQPSATRDRVPRALEPLHGKIEDCRRDFEHGLELIVSGERVLGENLLTASSERMRVLAETCALIWPGDGPRQRRPALGNVGQSQGRRGRSSRGLAVGATAGGTIWRRRDLPL